MATTIQQIVPHLWYDKEAKEAAAFYVSIFPDSRVKNVHTIHDTPSGSVDVVSFELMRQPFMAISAGPLFKFNESISFMVHCETQKEIDNYWKKLTAGGQEQPCGWLKDKFGLSWQIVPRALDQMMQSTDKERVARVTETFLKMTKLDIEQLNQAYDMS